MRYRPLLPLVMLIALIGAAALVTPSARAYPEASPAPISWQLDFEHQKPRPIGVPTASGETRWFWYMPYTVVNETGQARLFTPEFTIATDTGRIISAGRHVPATVFRQIQRQLGNDLLKSPVQVIGRILQGEDYALQSVAVWPAFQGEDVDEMSIFVTGLSGETHTIRNPVTGEPMQLRRTKMLTYRLPGNPRTPEHQPIVLKDEKAVLR